MVKKKVKCVVCGSEYDVCRLCPSDVKYTPWRTICDTQLHYQLHILVSEYSSSIISKEEAFECLKHIKVTDREINDLLPNVKEVLIDIISYKKENTKKSKSE